MTPVPGFEKWTAAHGPALLRTAWLLTGDYALAEDLVQTALTRCWARWSRIEQMDDVLAYVRRVVTTTYLSWWRRRWRAEVPTAELPDTADRISFGGDDRPALIAALRRLPRGQRAVIVLRFADDLSEAQTARALGCSIGTVKSQASRGLRALREDLTLMRETDRL